MVLIILTEDGLQSASEQLETASQIWLNQGLLTSETREYLAQYSATVHELPDFYDAHKDKMVVAALDYVEKQTQAKDIIIECP